MEVDSQTIPPTWTVARLDQVTEINPKLDKSDVPNELPVSFVPMPAVEAETGRIDVSGNRAFGEVKKGYTNFAEGDVLFAKITPCMENGKMAIVPKLQNDLGFGSTEFHVLRPYSGINAKWVYYFVTSQLFRRDAEHNMTGAVGQRRVPTLYLAGQCIPVPPTNEQVRVVAKVEELLSELDKGAESLRTARQQLKIYQQAILKSAFDGKLTARWREANKHHLGSADQLLARIRKDHDDSYSEKLMESESAVVHWEKRQGRRPMKAKKPTPLNPLIDPNLPKLPDGWLWFKYGDLCSRVRNGISDKPTGDKGAKIFRISAVRPMEFDLDDVRHIDNAGKQYDEYYLSAGDLVFTRYNGSRAYVGVCAEYRGDGTHLFPDKLIQTRIAASSILPSYVEKAVNCGFARAFVEKKIRTTAGQSGVSGSDVKAIPVPICDNEEQKELVQLLSEDRSRTDRLLAEIEAGLRRVETLRQSILGEAFSGKLCAQDPNDEPVSLLLKRISTNEGGARSTRNRREVKQVANG